MLRLRQARILEHDDTQGVRRCNDSKKGGNTYEENMGKLKKMHVGIGGNILIVAWIFSESVQ